MREAAGIGDANVRETVRVSEENRVRVKEKPVVDPLRFR
jgi:hypothetical protein